jgi:alpha-beta hydrolase superfamily lysophospholipase
MNKHRRRFLSTTLVGMAGLAVTQITGCRSTMAPDSRPTTGTFEFTVSDGTKIFVRRWADVPAKPKGVVQIAHGAAEHSERYTRFAQYLNANGCLAYANDHRGHGNTRVRSGKLGDAGPDAWNHFLGDVRELTSLIRRENPGLPVVLFGHSMGSFIAQDYMARYGTTVDAVVLCATSGVLKDGDQLVALTEKIAREDPSGPSKLFTDIFASFNQPFTGRPGFEWLSRDPAEVQKYMADPRNGFAFSNDLVREFFTGMRDMFRPEREARIPNGMPVLVIAGDKDPVGGNTQAVLPLLAATRATA